MSNMHHHNQMNNESINFANLLGTTAGKRRRMRSGGNVSTLTNNTPKGSIPNNASSNGDMASSKSSKGGTNTIPIFLKKTYKMVDTCDQKICSWSTDGEMFIVKDPDLFAKTIIPQYFDHNKFSSFARQLNFYGFRKMQSKPIRNADFDQDTAKHVTFYNEKFKRGRCDLLKEIQRSTRGGTSSQNTINIEDHQRELNTLKAKVATLEDQVKDLNNNMEERMRRLELDMLGRMEQMMLAMQQQQQTQLNLQALSGGGSSDGGGGVTTASGGGVNPMAVPSSIVMQANGAGAGGAGGHSWDPLPFEGTGSAQKPIIPGGSNASKSSGKTSNGSKSSLSNSGTGNKPTLPPHPKQKSLSALNTSTGSATGMLPGQMTLPPSRLNSLRGLSQNISRGLSVESTEFFSMLMLGNDPTINSAGNTGGGTNNPMQPPSSHHREIAEIDDEMSENTKEMLMNQ